MFAFGLRSKHMDRLKLVLALLAQNRTTLLTTHLDLAAALCKLLASPFLKENAVNETVNALFAELGAELVALLTGMVGRPTWSTVHHQQPHLIVHVLQLLILIFHRLRLTHGFELSLLQTAVQDIVARMSSGSNQSTVGEVATQLQKEFTQLCIMQREESNKAAEEHAVPAALAAAALAHASAHIYPDNLGDAVSRMAYRHLRVIPSLHELTNPPEDLPQQNRIDGSYQDGHHLLNTQVRLMKEDVVRSLREGVQAYLSRNDHKANDSVSIYKQVAFASMACDRNQGQCAYSSSSSGGKDRGVWLRCAHCLRGARWLRFFLHSGLIYRITFRTPRLDMQWERSQKLQFGSLVMLTKDALKTAPIWAELFKKDEKFMNGSARAWRKSMCDRRHRARHRRCCSSLSRILLSSF